jgi:hypothetical protein
VNNGLCAATAADDALTVVKVDRWHANVFNKKNEIKMHLLQMVECPKQDCIVIWPLCVKSADRIIILSQGIVC